jgi:hypothetical protein
MVFVISFDHTQAHTTVGTTPLDEGSVNLREFYHALDRAATGSTNIILQFTYIICHVQRLESQKDISAIRLPAYHPAFKATQQNLSQGGKSFIKWSKQNFHNKVMMNVRSCVPCLIRLRGVHLE